MRPPISTVSLNQSKRTSKPFRKLPLLTLTSVITKQKLEDFISNIETLPAQVKRNVFLIVLEDNRLGKTSDSIPLCTFE